MNDPVSDVVYCYVRPKVNLRCLSVINRANVLTSEPVAPGKYLKADTANSSCERARVDGKIMFVKQHCLQLKAPNIVVVCLEIANVHSSQQQRFL